MNVAAKARELLDNIAFENPPPEERWFQRDDFDPMHGITELRYAAKRGWIELDDTEGRETWRFRFTAAGRQAMHK